MEILSKTNYVMETFCVRKYGCEYYITKRENESFDEAVITDTNGNEVDSPLLIAEIKALHKS